MARTPGNERAKRASTIDQFVTQSNTVFGNEEMQQLKRETLESESSLGEVKLALKQWDQIQVGVEDTFKQSESLGDNAPVAHCKMSQNDPQNL